MENEALRIVVLPSLGGRIWSIVYKSLNREVLWHNPRVQPHQHPLGSTFDDVWCGGWEEMFPTAAPGKIGGVEFPDHGEVWCLPWEASAEEGPEAVTLSLNCHAPISGVRLEKRFSLREDEARVDVNYRITNPTSLDFPFLFAVHPAFAASDGDRIDFPPIQMDLEHSFEGTLEGVRAPFSWPYASRRGKQVDLRRVAASSSREVYFLYGSGYRSGWCALTDPKKRFSVGFIYSPEIFRSCWVFATYGGWRDFHVVLLEPSTSLSQQVETAIQASQAVRLPAGASWEAQVTFLAQEGLSSVGGISSDGKFRE